MAVRRDESVADDSLFVLPGLRDVDDPGVPSFSWGRLLNPGRVESSQQGAARDRSQARQVFIAKVVRAEGFPPVEVLKLAV